MKSLLCCFLGILILNFFSCNNASSNLEFVGSLPKTISESSGIEVTEKSNTIWTLEDSGNDSKLYALDQLGNLKHTLEITDQTNTDWEDLTSDQDGNLYIGDFGNNDNDRKDLSIYKINAADLSNANIKSSLKITFFYPEQTAFPPKKSKRFFDVESFFIRNNTSRSNSLEVFICIV